MKQNSGSVEQDEERYLSIVGNNDFVIFGGTVHNDDLFYDNDSESIAGVITRMDLAQNTIRWMRTYDADDGRTNHVEALALKSDASGLAVYAREARSGDFFRGFERGYLFVVRPADGGHITTKALRLTHDSNDQYRWITSSSAMVFNDYGNIVMGWYLWRFDMDDSDGYTVNGHEYDGKLRVGQYNYDQNEEEMEYYRE